MKMVPVLSGGNVARAIAASLLVWALWPHRYSYFALLRWVVCTVGAYSAAEAWRVHRTGFVWLCAVLSLLFNPLLPVHLDRGTWRVVDILAACLLAASAVLLTLAEKEERREAGCPMRSKH